MKDENLPKKGDLTRSMHTKDEEFLEFKSLVRDKVNSLPEREKVKIELYALRLKIEDYLNLGSDESISVGDFLSLYIKKLGLKQKELAEYVGLNPLDFNKILKGKKKISFDLSFKLGQIFSIDPKTWILIQVKEDYLKLKKQKAPYFEQYKLDDLLKPQTNK